MTKAISIKLEKWMTLRDRKIITEVYKHGILNSRQIEKIFFSDSKNARIIALRRLKRISDAGFLKVHWYGYNNRGTMQHFTITNKGSIIVASEMGIETSEIKVNDAGIISHIEHTSLIADFHVNLLENHFKVPNFTSDKLNHRKFNFLGKEHGFEPDGMGTMISSHNKRVYPFFLEVDRGTMSYNYFKLKIPNYEAYYASGYYTKDFRSFPLVFILTTDENRVKRMKEIIDKNKKSDITYLISTFEISKNMVFEVVGQDRKVALK